ncbi:MAG: EAL domain-containing protein [Cyanobacteria bacterium J06614_10]
MQHQLVEKRFDNASRDCSQVKAIALSGATASLLLVLSQTGLFQPAETKAFDLFTSLAAKYEHTFALRTAAAVPATAKRLTVVAITEEDIQSQKQWPLSDQVFAQVLSRLQQHSPRVIGLDIYRDVPHKPGTEALARALQKENVITITNLDSLGEVEVPSPLQVPDNRVGFNDFVVDPDGVIRRNFMFAALGDRELYSFSLRLVDQYLQGPAHKLTAEADALRIGNIRLASISPNIGGYQKIDADGYQTLGRYILPENVARQVSLSQVLSGDFDPSWITDNIVVIGTTAPSQKDLYYTPFSAEGNNDLLMSGVVLHAQMTQQLLSAVLEGRALLRGFPQWGEVLWVWGWGLVGGLTAWRFTHPGTLAIATGAGLVGLTAAALCLFSLSVWVPVVLPMTTFATTVAALIVYREFRKSFYDSLTGLPNRALLTQELQRMLRKPNQAPIGVILLDIDRFKVFNESFGLRVGDQFLQLMARRLKQGLPSKAKIARIAGDEFVVLLGWLPQREEAVVFAKTLNQKMTEPVEIRGQKLFPTISTGIAFSPAATDAHHALNAGDLLRDAQTAMSRAKSQGRGRCEIFVQDMRAHLSTRLGLESDLREALQKQELLLYYQPIICLKTMQLAGFEALIRWQHPEKGMISPAKFIPIAEDTGLIIPIGQWVLEVACQQAKQWQQQFPAISPFISVNLSGRQFAQKDLVEEIDQTLTKIAFDPAKLKLELTESVVMDDVEASIDVLLRLKALRLQLGIDDFGTGYSSLSYLHRFPIDTLKVDRSFVMEMESPSGTAELVKTIVSLGHNLGMTVVAEGIETESQSRQLQALQCEYGQGYLFARPLPPEAAESLLNDAPVWTHNAA